MKLLHTADWHAGRTLHGVSRTPEIRAALREVAALAAEEAVDLILVSGDLYDSRRPGPDAEEAVYEFFTTTGGAGIPSVVIAGNHDSPRRLEAVRGILELAHVHVIGEPKVAGQGGVFDLPIGDEVARIAALPFVSERRLVRVAELLEADPGQWHEKYRQGMRALLGNLTSGFSSQTVNLLLLHTAMEGVKLSGSEYGFTCTEDYCLGADALPSADYVALGHIHKPQAVQGFPENAGRYAGSLVQLDFGEQGEEKYAYIVEASAGKPTRLLKAHRIAAGRRLKRVKLNREELEERMHELSATDGWLKLTINLPRPEPGLKERLKATLPNLLIVEQLLPAHGEDSRGVDHQTTDLAEAYAQFYTQERGGELPEELRAAFLELYQQTEGRVA
jgi:exonuclease SbcD